MLQRVSRPGRLLGIALVLLASACSSGSNGTPTSSATPALGADVLRKYVADLDKGDIAAANQLRCTKGRVPANLLDQWGSEVARVRTAAGGSLAVASVAGVSPVTLASLDGNAPAGQLSYTISTPSGPSTPIELAVISEGGALVLCGAMQTPAVPTQRVLAQAVIAGQPGTITTLATALPATVLAGYVEADERAVADLTGIPGATEGWTRVWNTPGLAGLRVSLFRTAGRSDSDTLAHRLLASPGLDSAATIDNLDNGFVGVSVVASAWTWVQPASIGLRVDRAVAVVGDVVVSVELGGVDVKDGHRLLQQVATALHWP